MIASMTARRGRGVDEWTATADRLAQEAAANAAAGRTYSAAGQYLRASLYYSVATYSADGTGDPALFASLWENIRPAGTSSLTWGTSVGRSPSVSRSPMRARRCPGISSVPARPVPAARRTLIFNNGSDGSVVGAWTDGIAGALARGWNAMTFDGPGQNAALVRQGLAFRPDWEKVITPVVDFLSARADVDGEKLALLGVSQAGYWAAPGACF